MSYCELRVMSFVIPIHIAYSYSSFVNIYCEPNPQVLCVLLYLAIDLWSYYQTID